MALPSSSDNAALIYRRQWLWIAKLRVKSCSGEPVHLTVLYIYLYIYIYLHTSGWAYPPKESALSAVIVGNGCGSKS